MPRQPEGRLARSIRAYAEEQGACVFNIHGSDSPFQEVGIPDLLMCYRGWFVGVEVKLGTEVSAKQRAVMLRIEKADGITVVARSVADVSKVFSQIDRIGGG